MFAYVFLKQSSISVFVSVILKKPFGLEWEVYSFAWLSCLFQAKVVLAEAFVIDAGKP